MKALALIAATLLAAAPALAAGDHGHDHGHEHGHAHEALHGGIVVEAKDMDFELVAKPESLQLYVRDDGQPVDVSGASAKATLLAGTEKQDVALQPAGGRLEAQGSFKVAPGTKLVAVVTLPGKGAATARFTIK